MKYKFVFADRNNTTVTAELNKETVEHACSAMSNPNFDAFVIRDEVGVTVILKRNLMAMHPVKS
jgi:hypothetical protein